MGNLQPVHEDYYSNYNYSNYKITEINKEARLQYKIDEKNAKIDTSLYDEASFIKNTEGTSTQMTEIMQIVARTAEQKIKEAQIVIKKLQEANLYTISKEISNKIRRLSYVGFKVAAANLSNMSQFAMQFTNSFGDISSKIRRRTY